MNIVLINQYAGPEKYCPAYRPMHLARQWTRLGHEVTIVGSSFSHFFTRMPDFLGDMTTEWEYGVRYLLLRTPSYQGNGLGRVANMLCFVRRLRRLSRWVVTTLKPDVVVSGSVHGLDFLPARVIALDAGALLVREVRDLWPLTLLQLGEFSQYHPLILLLQWAERFSYEKAHLVTTTLPKSLSHMESHGLTQDRWKYIPQAADPTVWDDCNRDLPQLHRDCFQRIAMEGKSVVGYAGAHGVANALWVLLDAARLLQTKSIAFVMVGQGPEKEALQERAKELRLSSVHFLPPIPRQSIPGFLSAVDVAYIGWRNEPIYRYGISPNKLMDYMLAAKPVVHSVNAGNDLVSESGCGVSVPAESPGAVAAAIEELIRMPSDQRAEMGRKGREHILHFYSYSGIAERYLEILTSYRSKRPLMMTPANGST